MFGPASQARNLANTAVSQVQGKDVNLGRHVSEDAAAKAYDKAAICARGKDAAKLNFEIGDYESELEQLEAQTVVQLAPILRFQSYLCLGKFVLHQVFCILQQVLSRAVQLQFMLSH